MSPTKLAVMLSAYLLATGAVFCIQSAGSAAEPSSRVRVGAYDSRAVAIAAVRSGVANEQIQKLQQQLRDAEAAGDERRASQIKNRGKTLQTVRHLQAFSNAPIDDFLIELKDRLPEIAREENVSVIISHADYTAPGVEVVDLTARLVSEFNPDEQTSQVIESMKGKAPIDMVEVLMGKD